MTKQNRGRRLKVKELQDLLARMRKWPREFFGDIAQLYNHVLWLQATLDEAERELREIRQVNMFEKDKIKTPKNPHASPRNEIRLATPPRPSSSPGERMYYLITRGGIDGTALRSYCELMKTTPEQCFAIADAWAEENGKAKLRRED